MNQYHIRIDGEQSTDSYTYQELVDMGLFELDTDSLNGIEVKKTTEPNFSPLRSYCFPERHSNENSNYVDEYGQIHRRDVTPINDHNGDVEEFDQSVRDDHPSRSSFSWTTLWRIIETIIVIGFVIAISVETSGYGIPIAVGAYYALRAIWNGN